MRDSAESALNSIELCLCLCEGPTECWQVVLAAEAACRINLKPGSRIAAKEYCERYFQMAKKAPWAVDERNGILRRF